MRDGAVSARVQVGGPADADADEIDRLAHSLREELLQTDLEDVRPVSIGSAPEGSKAGEVVQLGVLLVAVAPTALQAVVDAIRRWRERQHGASVTITLDGDSIELGRATPEQQDELMHAFLTRHGTSGS
jgi:hypothetical protein